MAMKKSKGLGSNPLSSGIFSKTDSSEAEETSEVEVKSQESKVKSHGSKVESRESRVKNQESRKQKDSESSPESRKSQPSASVPTPEQTVNTQESRVENIESRNKNIESRFLNRDQAELRGTNVRLPIELIDWVDELVKQGSRDKNKSRIPKEVWFQAALELFQAMPVDWDTVSDEDELRETLYSLESRIKNL